MNETTIDKMYSAFINKFTAIYDQSFPLVKVNNKCRTLPRKPWLTPGLANCCFKKEKLYTKFIKNLPIKISRNISNTEISLTPS